MNEDLREIKLQTEQIADLLELDVADFEQADGTTEVRPIAIKQNTEVSPTVDQFIDRTAIVGCRFGTQLSFYEWCIE